MELPDYGDVNFWTEVGGYVQPSDKNPLRMNRTIRIARNLRAEFLAGMWPKATSLKRET